MKTILPEVLEFELEELETLSAQIFSNYKQIRVWILEGPLGAGKTTFVQNLAKGIGIEEQIVSPTFSLLNEYHSDIAGKVCHLDLYRLNNISELDEIGLFEIEERGYFCLVEWASAVSYTPSVPWLEIRLEHMENTKRKIRIQLHEN
jgi:tRNA threonylcarbamoyladenosine biosynthesis protein TsaE